MARRAAAINWSECVSVFALMMTLHTQAANWLTIKHTFNPSYPFSAPGVFVEVFVINAFQVWATAWRITGHRTQFTP